MKVPASRYRLSDRSYPEELPAIEYGTELEVRRVQSSGLIRFKGYQVRIGKAFTGEPVGLMKTMTEGLYEVFYCHQKIGWVDTRSADATPGKTVTMLHKMDG